MPITEAKFQVLPKVSATSRKKGGRKVNWMVDVYPGLREQGWLVREVYDIALAVAAKDGNTISRVRTKRWLDSLVDKKLARIAADENAFVYFVK